ncbi:MAG: glycosyltransferase [Actinobacteria bacterium]|nr:MAG: glycosyltransferase [Actinomycetota bacterium]
MPGIVMPVSTDASGAGPLILDLQALQSPHHRDRGIGRWSFEFTRALCDAHPDLVGAILLNPALPEPDDLGELAATGKVHRAGEVDLSSGRIYHVLSPFELDEPLARVWPPSGAGNPMRLVVTLYDLIPEVFASQYLADPGQRRRYRARLELVRAADRVLAISGASRDEAIARLGIDAARVTTIGAGISPAFQRPASRAEAAAEARRGMVRLEDPFIFCVGGEDDRKNVEGLLRGFALLPRDLRAAHQLVVAFGMTDGYRRHLEGLARRLGIARRLYLPGYIDDATLIAAYQSTDLFVFPSHYEGYGLPVAEAMACGALVVSSNVSAPAAVTAPEGQFDPDDPADIAATMGRALTDRATHLALRRASERPPPTWGQAAEEAVKVYRELLASPPPPARSRGRRKLRVAFVTPLPPQGSGVAIYSYRLLEALAPHCEVDVFVDALEGGLEALPSPPRAPAGIPVHAVEHLERVEAARGGYDVLVYAIGNSEFHTGALGLARKRPGVVLAHDVRLAQLYAFAAHHGTLAPDTFRSIHHALYPDAPPPPDPLLVAPATLNSLPEPMAGELIGTSLRFLTTSEFAAGLARQDARPEDLSRVGVLPHALRLLAQRPEPAEPVVASFGVVNPTKATGALLDAFAIVLEARPDARLRLVGPGSPEDLAGVRSRAETLGIGGAVTMTGRVDDAAWDRHLSETMVAVQLRASTNGEFSGAVAETLAAGIPTILSALGSAAELPDDAAIKLPTGATPTDLAAEILALLDDAARRKALSEGARAYAATLSFEAVAEELYGLLKPLASRHP